MTDLDPRVVQEIDSYARGFGAGHSQTIAREEVARIARLAADCERERCAKDAVRYQWLRDKSVPPHNFYISVPVEFGGVRYAPQEVDAAIDAAIRGAKP